MQNSKFFSIQPSRPNAYDRGHTAILGAPLFNKNQLGEIRHLFNCRAEPLVTSVDLAFARKLEDIATNNLAEYYLNLLERKKFTSFKFPKRKIEWLAGRIAAKTATCNLLHRDTGSKPAWQNLQISSDSAGRPFCKIQGIAQKNIPDISISHSGSFAVALAASRLCGIDIQEITNSITRVVSRFTAPMERNILLRDGRLPETALLTLLWSAKEAVRKAFPRQPLPGFMELCLESFTAGADSFIGQFSCERQDMPTIINFYCLQYENYALALVID